MYTENLFSLERTLAAPLFAEIEYPWQIPQMLEDYIYKLGATLDKEKYAEINTGIWVAKNAKIDSRATLTPPLIIDEAAEIRTGAYLRGSVIVGKGSVVGNSSEIKCALLLECKKIESAVNLLPFGRRAIIENIISNIIYLGLPKRIEFLDKKDGCAEDGGKADLNE